MKKILLLGAALSLIGGVALAETSPPPSDAVSTSEGGPGVKTDYDRPGPDWGWGHGPRHGWAGGPGDRGFHHGPPGGPPGGGPDFLSKGPHVVLEHRGNRIDVKCAENDSTQQCVDAVKGLLSQIADTMGRDRPDGPFPDRPEAPEGPAQ